MAYADGNGVAKDLVESYMWYELVVCSGDTGAELDRDDTRANSNRIN
jgi:TPR repeat protein